jgi:hypothetical protein
VNGLVVLAVSGLAHAEIDPLDHIAGVDVEVVVAGHRQRTADLSEDLLRARMDAALVESGVDRPQDGIGVERALQRVRFDHDRRPRRRPRGHQHDHRHRAAQRSPTS